MKSDELQMATELVARRLDSALEDAVERDMSTEAYAVAILHYVSDVLVKVFGMTPDDVAVSAAKLARSHHQESILH